jgi:hypothetical protein
VKWRILRFLGRRKRYEWLFVVTYGRSGSTLVQGLLNALPRTLVRGENGFYPLGLFHAEHRGTDFARIHMNHEPRKSSSAFYGVQHLTPQAFARDARHFMTRLLLGSMPRPTLKRLGFKEVLWHEIAPEETEEFFAWFERVFPNAKYVLNTRDQEMASTSGFWQQQGKDAALAAMARVVEIQEYLRTSRPDRVVDTRYEVVTGADKAASDAELRKLATFVTGACDDALLSKLRGVLAVGHGPNPFGKSRKKPAAKKAAGNAKQPGSGATDGKKVAPKQ